jgi:hypothetical protein
MSSRQCDRQQIRAFVGFRPIEVAEEGHLRRSLETEAVPRDPEGTYLRIPVAAWRREQRLEPPAEPDSGSGFA